MATTEEVDVPPEVITVADRFGNIWEEVRSLPDKAADVVYAPRRRSLWPLILAGVAIAALVVGGTVAAIVGAIAVLLLVAGAVTRD